ncbi:MAG: tRNA uridine-5-carboxymethylaminomethyl(34) synthesis GTPase MnmE [Vicinamibacterales bacterium]
MFSTSDTIVAIATPPGRGGIGVVRISGPSALSAAGQLLDCGSQLAARHATLTVARGGSTGSGQREPIDQVIATYFPAPASYTGEDVVELSAHGSPVVLQAIVAESVRAGARIAEPGEFTLRAYLNGRIDLPQAEAVADLIDAVTPLQTRAAFDQMQGTLTRVIAEVDEALFDLMARLEASIDFPEEGYHFIQPADLASAIGDVADRLAHLLADARRGRLLREGLTVVILGRPNVGKSSLFNALVGVSRAIVTDVPGTTRDLITESVDINGLRVTLVDTAGLRADGDIVEREGMSRSRGAAAVADMTLLVFDGSRSLDAEDESQLADCGAAIVVASKADLASAWSRGDAISVSARTGVGLEELRARIVSALDRDVLHERPAITNVRHAALVERAWQAASRAKEAALASNGEGLSEEFVLADLQDARSALEEVTGRRTPDDVLAHVFARFCVGK